MNVALRLKLPDVQSQPDTRNIYIDDVGIKSVRYPMTICSGGKSQPTIATLSMTVGLSAAVKGTHMSRFIELLEAQQGALDQDQFERMVRDMLQRLNASTGAIEIQFPYFVMKTAPISGVNSRLDYEVRWLGSVTDGKGYAFSINLTVPVTTLCPCSREISRYGAHNQRSHVRITANLVSEVPIEELIAIAERNASCEVYSLMKRSDEKYVTERAYENPKFVEDLVRDVALALRRDQRVSSFTVEAENYESIHNHSAFARIVQLPTTNSR
jgi:GTP cyclohydrolase I